MRPSYRTHGVLQLIHCFVELLRLFYLIKGRLSSAWRVEPGFGLPNASMPSFLCRIEKEMHMTSREP